MSKKKQRSSALISFCMRRAFLAAAAILVTVPAHAALVAQGSPFQVNTAVFSSFGSRSAAIAGNGRFAIVWSAKEGNDAFDNIYVRLFASDGTPLGPEFTANSTPAVSDEFSPVIAMDATGNFVVGWSDGILRARMFDANGTPLGEDFCIDAGCPASRAESALAMDNAGDWVAAWQYEGNSPIEVRRFNRDGAPKDVSPLIVVDATGGGSDPSLAVNRTNGDFAVAWKTTRVTENILPYTDFELDSIHLQRYHADGSAARRAVQVATCPSVDSIVLGGNFLGCELDSPRATSDDAGNLTILWQQDAVPMVRIYAARLRADALKPAKRFEITSSSSATLTTAAEDGAGEFVSVLQTKEPAVFGQAVAADNQLDGAAIRIATTEFADFSMNSAGDAVAIWMPFGTTTINAQRYSVK